MAEPFVCECGWRCEWPGCPIPPAEHECMWCGAEGPTFWNGEPADCRRVVVVVADAEFPAYWARKHVGQERRAVEITYNGRTFYIDNENGSGWAKVRFAGGGPQAGHSSLAIERVVASLPTCKPDIFKATYEPALGERDRERLLKLANIIGAVHRPCADPELHEDDAWFLHSLVSHQPDSEQRYTVEEWKERMLSDEAVDALVYRRICEQHGGMYSGPGGWAQAQKDRPTEITNVHRPRARADLEAAFNKASEHSEEGGDGA